MSPKTVPTFLAGLVLAAYGVGCNDESPFGASQTPPDQEPAGYTDPAALLTAYAKALELQDLALSEKLLDENFEYFPQGQDLVDFPWLQGQLSWSRTDELQMIAHMFDDNFAPADPQACGTVDTIDAAITIDSQQAFPDGTYEVMCQANFTVIYTTDGNGARADVRLEFRLVTAADGYLRIRSIRELPPYQRAVARANWATIKSLYR